MVYVEFILWMVLIVFCGIGVYRLWARMVKPAWLAWALLPATIVSEMAYIFGCLITGGEIRHARLLSLSQDGDAAGATEAAPRWKVLGPVVAALLAILACAGAIGLADWVLGEPVMKEFGFVRALADPTDQPAALTSWDAFWLRMENQLKLLRRMCETFVRLDWLDWRVPLFVYLAACLSIRLAPVRRDIRATLAAVGIVAVAIVLIGTAGPGPREALEFLRPVLTYVWGVLLLLLAVTLAIWGVVGLGRALGGRSAQLAPARPGARPRR
ncbi:MAG TPA: hypothetical protein VM695_03110 [Phycisphaerae bacterium]|nr:hypothetical protein [Phycisphaerae bacterium]